MQMCNKPMSYRSLNYFLKFHADVKIVIVQLSIWPINLNQKHTLLMSSYFLTYI